MIVDQLTRFLRIDKFFIYISIITAAFISYWLNNISNQFSTAFIGVLFILWGVRGIVSQAMTTSTKKFSGTKFVSRNLLKKIMFGIIMVVLGVIHITSLAFQKNILDALLLSIIVSPFIIFITSQARLFRKIYHNNLHLFNAEFPSWLSGIIRLLLPNSWKKIPKEAILQIDLFEPQEKLFSEDRLLGGNVIIAVASSKLKMPFIKKSKDQKPNVNKGQESDVPFLSINIWVANLVLELPEELNLDIQLIPFLGIIEDKRLSSSDSSTSKPSQYQLRLTGLISFGRIQIVNSETKQESLGLNTSENIDEFRQLIKGSSTNSWGETFYTLLFLRDRIIIAQTAYSSSFSQTTQSYLAALNSAKESFEHLHRLPTAKILEDKNNFELEYRSIDRVELKKDKPCLYLKTSDNTYSFFLDDKEEAFKQAKEIINHMIPNDLLGSVEEKGPGISERILGFMMTLFLGMCALLLLWPNPEIDQYRKSPYSFLGALILGPLIANYLTRRRKFLIPLMIFWALFLFVVSIIIQSLMYR